MLETDLWRYDYTLKNTSDPILDEGFDIYEVFFEYDFNSSFSVLSLPADWDLTYGSGFGTGISLVAGPSPFGSDIAPGQSLSGFSFLFDYQAGALPFEVTFANPEDVDNPVIMAGNSAPGTIPVPEPSTMISLLLGLTGVFVVRRYANMTSSNFFCSTEGMGGFINFRPFWFVGFKPQQPFSPTASDSTPAIYPPAPHSPSRGWLKK
ncbi:PEP-CTERM sorting domain-containing protein [Desulfococcus sp.]|uniref:PEP-CTERM sorting domain-containing protein n=1 Tax=Desulfococcus sp. TaxID=2025834 RepID=UPI003592E8B8